MPVAPPICPTSSVLASVRRTHRVATVATAEHAGTNGTRQSRIAGTEGNGYGNCEQPHRAVSNRRGEHPLRTPPEGPSVHPGIQGGQYVARLSKRLAGFLPVV